MNISISAVSENRKFTKGLVKFSKRLQELKTLGSFMNSSAYPFDTLQVVFVDEKEGYINSIGCKKNDKLFQVEMAIPSDKIVDYSNESSFADAIMKDTVKAAWAAGVSEEDCKILEEQWKK